MGLKGGISIDADSGPHGYVLWCCGSRSQDFFTFIQVGPGQSILWNTAVISKKNPTLKNFKITLEQIFRTVKGQDNYGNRIFF